MRTPTLTLIRERNGWCVDSARLWLALELKGVRYDTVREIASSAPALTIGDLTVSDSLDALRRLDAATPDAPPLWPPAGVASSAVDEMTEAFASAMPQGRQSTRAAFLFCREEGSQYDALPRATFEATLDEAERLLSRHTGGPFLCGSALSAADVAWAPVLERYAVHLPCLHAGLLPRGGRWERLTSWYEAMDGVPAYACRVRGDARSWCRVLSSSPWWPAGWPARGDPAERGDPRGGALALTADAAADAFGGPPPRDLPGLWASYAAASKEDVAASPSAEAAAALRRNAAPLLADARAYGALPTSPTDATDDGPPDADGYEAALERLVELLLRARGEPQQPQQQQQQQQQQHGANPPDAQELEDCSDRGGDACEEGDAVDDDVKALLAYLDERMCVPRDWGAPVAAVIRELHARHGDAAAPDGTFRVVRVNNF